MNFDCRGCWDHNFVYHILVQNFHFRVFIQFLRLPCDKISGLDNELERRGVTYTLWNQSTIKGKTRSWHPLTFDYADAAPQKLNEIKVCSSTTFDLVI